MKFKQITALVCAFGILTSSALASVLGSERVTHSVIDIGHGATLETNSFYSDQSGVGLQSEYFVQYSPNGSLIPAIINDEIYGKATTSSVAQGLTANGLNPSFLMNSDFFALNTGVPLSHQIAERQLLVMDADDMNAVGFNYDSTAFIAPLGLDVTAKIGTESVDIGVVNKVRQPYFIYMYTDKFSDTTRATGNGVNIVIGSLEGSLSIGETLTGTVESVTFDSGAVAIPDGKIVLSADFRLDENILNNMYLFNIGDKVEFSVTATGDKRWKDARYVIGAWGGVILRDSEFTGNDEAAAPRTALGIKEDGTIIFYALDGRQSGHSYGARLKTLAQRLKELGCTDAVNFDGGGSTTIGAVYPGKDKFTVINSPSDGYERKVSTLIGLINTKAPTGNADKLFVYPYHGNYLSGATETFSALATDSEYYSAPLNQSVTFTSPDGTVSQNGKVKITGEGQVYVTATSGNLQKTVTLTSYRTPTSITVKNGTRNVTNLSLKAEESVNLDAYASAESKSLAGDDSCFEWKCDESIGTIDSQGFFTAGNTEAEGTISITAGEYTKNIKVKVTPKAPEYIKVQFREDIPCNVTVEFDSPVSNEHVSLKIDGKKTIPEIKENKIRLSFSDGKTHKINVTVANDEGYKTVAGYTVKGTSGSNIFEDITDIHWAKDIISYMKDLDIIKGISINGKNYFMPQNSITRGEFAVMVANVMGVDPSDFADAQTLLTDAHKLAPWCADHVKALYELGIMNGKYTDGKLVFDQEATLTRSEAAAVISRLLPDNVEMKEVTFSDKASIPGWCKDAFSKLSAMGIVNGYSDGSVKPLDNITRSEVIKMLYEIY